MGRRLPCTLSEWQGGKCSGSIRERSNSVTLTDETQRKLTEVSRHVNSSCLSVLKVSQDVSIVHMHYVPSRENCQTGTGNVRRGTYHHIHPLHDTSHISLRRVSCAVFLHAAQYHFVCIVSCVKLWACMWACMYTRIHTLTRT
jgi:hypothetical protein